MFDVIDQTLRRSQHAAANVHPSMDRMLTTPIRHYALAWIRAATLANSLRHEAPIVPSRLYRVDPCAIEQSITWNRISANRKADEHPRFRPPNYRLAGRVFDGDWDRSTSRVEKSTIHRSFRGRFIEGKSWESTQFFEETLAAIRAGGSPWDCTSREDLKNRCQYLDELYQAIKNHGYKSQDELYDLGFADISDNQAHRRIWGEVAISVGRDGELLFQDGRNRLAIAQLLELESIPVVILVRHKAWQQTRDRIARNRLTSAHVSEDIVDHPDVRDLLFE